MVSRRSFLQSMCGTAVLALSSTLYPGMLLANAQTDRRLVIVILRGGMDGLGALAPYGDPNYEALRGDLALNTDTLLRIDPFFGLHPNLEIFADLYKKGHMIAVPASASPYRARSHFDAQNVLELGSTKPYTLESGWLNRVVAAISSHSDLGIAFGQGVPTMLRGQRGVNSWAPSAMSDPSDDYLSLIGKIYASDPILSAHYSKAQHLQEMSMHIEMENENKLARKSRSPQAFVTMSEVAGKWLSKRDGPRIATLELGGWDTHAGQGTEGGRLANNLSLFARGIKNLRDSLGSEWDKTVVVAMTEFGRTARPNGNRGTDHGTASTAFLFGGALKGGRIVHDWPGLADADLYQNRDLRASVDIRSIMKGVLHEHYGISKSVLDRDIYPDSASAAPLMGLL